MVWTAGGGSRALGADKSNGFTNLLRLWESGAIEPLCEA